MNVGIKFCGGCNPRYDRGSEYSKLTKECPDVNWVRGNDKEICDVWLAICGCSRECIDISELAARKEVIVLKNPIDFQKAKERIEQIKKRETREAKRKVLVLGQEASIEQKITQKLIQDFAAMTGDFNKLHTDAVFSATQWFQKPVMHGMFLSSLLSSVMGMQLPGDGTVLMEENTKFQSPAFIGDTITATITLTSYEDKRVYYIGCLKGVCKNQDGKVLIEMTAKQMMMKNLFEIKEGES